MSYPIIAVCPPNTKDHPHVAKYTNDVHVNPGVIAESRFMRMLVEYQSQRYNWWYTADKQAADIEAVLIINNPNHPQYCQYNRVYEQRSCLTDVVPTIIDFACYHYNDFVLTDVRIPADILPVDKQGYILLNADRTDVVDIVFYAVPDDDDLVFIDLEADTRPNCFVDKAGAVFTEGRVGDIDFEALDRQVTTSSIRWFEQNAKIPKNPRMKLSSDLLRISACLSNTVETPDEPSPAKAKTLHVQTALDSEYCKLRVIKPDGQVLQHDGYDSHKQYIGKYISDYLRSLPDDTWVKLYWE